MAVAVPVAVAVLLLPAAAARRTPVRLIAFSHSGDIRSVKADGGGARNLTRTPDASEAAPAWSPDGSQLAYMRGTAVWEMSADGTTQHEVVPSVRPGFQAATAAGVAWSSTNRIAAPPHLIAFVHGTDIWTVDTSGRDARNLTKSPGIQESSPSWSPDGSAIAYLRGAEIWEMRPDGSEQHRVVPGPPGGFDFYVEGAGVAWSSTGELAYVTWDEHAHRPELAISNADGTGGRPLPLDPNLPGETRAPWYLDLAWSPSGDRLYFALDNIQDQWGIFSVAADGSALTHLYGTSAGYIAPAFSPDGSRVIYTRSRGGTGRVSDFDIRLAKENGARPRWLTRARGDDSGGSWSPDSRRVVFASQRGDKPLRIGRSPTDLFVIDVGSRKVRRLLRLPGAEFDPQWQPG